MRIGFDAKRAFLNSTGLGNYSRNTLISLKKYFPDNEYVLFTPEIRNGIFPEQGDFEVYSPDNTVTKILKSFWRSISLNRVLMKKEIDLFHGLSQELPPGIKNSQVRSVVTIHDLIFMRFPHLYKPIDRKIYYRKVKFATEVADKVIAISRQTKDDIIKYLKVEPERIEVVYQPISSRFFDVTDTKALSQVLKKYNLPEKYILSLGTIESRKNHLNILKAIQSGNIDVPLVIVGRPTTYVQNLLDYISENNMERKIHFLDKVPDEDLPAIYRGAQFLAYVSFFEGFGLPLIEAMASGCPVVTSNTSCLPEVAGDAACFCDPGDVDEIKGCFINLLDNRKLREGLIEKGRERAMRFSPKISVAALMDVYKKVMVNA
ncbi:Mannosyltransferase [hydrothermal vent metagenome]|uniref:Mannosyltransferase n=1 Tax=hydrothermal vent metagenome TaxID=652676 RepID=A0A3B0TNY7_9ZZZZ